ncbi:glycosyltransferase family 4 protein [Plebeiibacterium sediminum]|uniref:Glycosyltransferase family 4 protein n=1 Tax=Plebeiibacterium sediminum TaxID=2992112 RepID=A0AAE3M3N7_9BACT|nr:glycosyltransferase family 4 protein [Plebeiobacterium sediminum]MCW3786656.1 glycosyltransferase family 4 protein [Plebeiobacterium sediminum]
MKIAFVSISENENNKKTWSGTIYKSYMSIKTVFPDTTFISAANQNDFLGKILVKFWLNLPRFLNKPLCMGDTLYAKRLYSKKLKKINFDKYDAIFVSGYAVIVASLPTTKTPIIYLSDAPFSALINYYPENTNLLKWNEITGNWISKKAFKRSKTCILSSEWAKKAVISDYKIETSKLKVIEFGANIEDEYLPSHPLLLNDKIKQKNEINLLLVGVLWSRKGGDVAAECCLELNKKGYNTTLHIVGMKIPDKYCNYSSIKGYGFYDKDNPDEYKKYVELISKMDVFLFPSKAECSSIALCEAAGFGLPAISYETGGTPNYIVNGINGYMLSLDSTGNDFSNKIIEIIEKNELDTLSKGAKELYNTKLNWDIWSQKVKLLLKESV